MNTLKQLSADEVARLLLALEHLADEEQDESEWLKDEALRKRLEASPFLFHGTEEPRT